MVKVFLHIHGSSPSYHEKIVKDVSDAPPGFLKAGSEVETEAGPATVTEVYYASGEVHAQIRLRDPSRISELPAKLWRNVP